MSNPAKASGDDDDILCDLGNNSIDEGPAAKMPVASAPKNATVRKLKKKPMPHYLTGTAASRGQ